jgi:acyl carrier protein
MNDAANSQPRRTADEIQEWMVAYIAKELEIAPEEIDVTVPFESFAIDSAVAIGMSGELENWLGKRVDPMLVYDYPTIEEMSGHLAGDAASQA